MSNNKIKEILTDKRYLADWFDGEIEPGLKKRVIDLFIAEARKTGANPELLRHWEYQGGPFNGLSYWRQVNDCEGGRLILEREKEGCYDVQCFLCSEKAEWKRRDLFEKWADFTVEFSCSAEELEPLFAAIDAAGITEYLLIKKAAKEGNRMLQLEEAIAEYVPVG